MSKDPFLLVNLKDSKELGQVMSSNTARFILDELAESKKGLSETELSKKLELPLSTVHYNLQALKKARLVKTDEFHYSPKGKEVLHYRLANKLIIIAPDESTDWKDKLKKLLPGLGLLALGGAIIEWAGRATNSVALPAMKAQRAFAGSPLADMTQEAVAEVSAAASPPPEALSAVVNATNDTVNHVAADTMATIPTLMQEVSRPLLSQTTLFFLLGGALMLVLLTLWWWRHD